MDEFGDCESYVNHLIEFTHMCSAQTLCTVTMIGEYIIGLCPKEKLADELDFNHGVIREEAKLQVTAALVDEAMDAMAGGTE